MPPETLCKLVMAALFALLGGCATDIPSQPRESGLRHTTASPGPAPDASAAIDRAPVHAWDNFRHRAVDIWACREVNTGVFVSDKYCRDKEKRDAQWPGMEVPSSYRGLIVDW
ncbi:hypothetical protein [Massilia alkalitolerans]|uniref:hypothetical protein n=1 Tax=Massilia alkalitolerans TaxID=286638 RepID=UPI0028B175A6|nr:hypothetical protein [Massilia alkalitolerans]